MDSEILQEKSLAASGLDKPNTDKTPSTGLTVGSNLIEPNSNVRSTTNISSTPTDNSSNAQPEGTTIHPDIEEGARKILEKELVDSVRIGSIAGIRADINNLQAAWIQAQKAAGAEFEITSEGANVIPDRLKAICSGHLQEGLVRLLSITEYSVSMADASSITDNEARLRGLFQIADEYKIPLTVSPIQGRNEQPDPGLVSVLSTQDKIISHLHELINQNLPKGLHHLITSLGDTVGKGLLNQLPDKQKKIDGWIDIMGQRGWNVVEHPTSPPVTSDTQPGIMVRELNRTEINKLIQQTIRDNLEKGIKRIPEMVKFLVQKGWSQPLGTWGSEDQISLYTQAAEKYGLNNNRAVALEGSTESANAYDLSDIPRLVREAVVNNLPEGFNSIIKSHLDCIMKGDTSQTKYHERILGEYFDLAEKYGVSINRDQMTVQMSSHFTKENLSAGVRNILEELRTAIKKGNYLSVSVTARKATEFKQFIHEQNFDADVDFSQLDKYMDETATNLPQLT